MPQTEPEPLFTTAQVAERLNVKPDTLTQWRYRGHGPSFIRISQKLVLYRASAIEQWLDECEQGAARHAPG